MTAIERAPEVENLLRRAYEAHQQGDPGPMTRLTTAVLHREDGDWKFVLWTVSLLVRNEALQAAWPPNG